MEGTEVELNVGNVGRNEVDVADPRSQVVNRARQGALHDGFDVGGWVADIVVRDGAAEKLDGGGAEGAFVAGEVDVGGAAGGKDLVDVFDVGFLGGGKDEDVVEVDNGEGEGVGEEGGHEVLENGGGGCETHGEAGELVQLPVVAVDGEVAGVGVEGDLMVT
jgi:hypothetical protein